MKNTFLLLLLILILSYGCNNRRSSGGTVDTLVADTGLSGAPIIDSAAMFDQLDEFDAESENQQAAVNVQNDYFMIVGCFTVPQNANDYAKSLEGKGYNAAVIPGRDSFQMVSVQSYDSYQESISEIEKYRNEITPDAWVHVRN